MSLLQEADLLAITRHVDDQTGLFDALLASLTHHLDSQLTLGTLNQEQYTSLYLQLVQTAMQQALNYLLQKPQVDAQTNLINAQVATQEKERDRIAAQIANIEAETALAQARLPNVAKEGEVLDAQITQAGKQNDLMDEQILQAKQAVLQSEAETDLIQQNRENAIKQNSVMDEQIDKLKADTELVEARTETEKANYQGDPSGLIGKKIELYEAQKTAFATDASIKEKQILKDVFSIMRGTNPEIQPPTTLYPAAGD